ncbi:hypothetical protein BJV82DRAFT_178848 [Fennellomyces sp. T-0311]|nr:hypothetical protein BJV82DRAFT_178848 [Fennellomyces sp. T-0311]
MTIIRSSSSSSYLPAHVLAQDRDSGISTEGESDAEIFNQSRPMTRQAYPFSDDDELPALQEQVQAPENNEALFSSKSYHNHQAEQAMTLIKQLVKEDSWKKALKHKSGVMVYMKQQQSNKAPIFKGETVIHGFSPQSVFYVIGMRKLWDSSFEEGRLIENLNETSSITYESYHSSSSSKAYDVALVERIECSADGVILFACTSIETPKIPKVPGRARRQMKLQGWVLKPLHTTPPSTKVTFITQESVKGWIPGLTKKSLARRPLVIADVQKYLQQKAERSKENRSPASASLLTPTTNATGQRRPSIMTQPKPKSILQSSLLHPRNNSMQSILTHPPPRNSSLPSPTSSRSSSVTRRIKFADDDASQRSSATSIAPPTEDKPDQQKENTSTTSLIMPTKLYPPSRHRTSRKQCIDTLKRLTSSDLDEWKELGERNSTKLYSKSVQGSTLPILRGDVTIHSPWTAEQVCSVIQCFGARKIWDEYFETGHVAERFSQKEYLVYTQMRSIFPIHSRDFALLTTIDSDPGTGTIHVASTSVSDSLIPTIKPHVRGRIIVYGWALRPLKSGVRVTFVSHMDLEGTTPLPPAIIRQLTMEVPACVDRVQWYLRQHGCPPYIRRVAGKIMHEQFDSKDKSYRITFTAKHKPSHHRSQTNWCTDIRTHTSMYSCGFSVQTTPADHTRVELRADDMGIRVYTLDDAVEGRLVEVAVVPNLPGSPPKYTWNGHSLKEEKKPVEEMPPPILRMPTITIPDDENDKEPQVPPPISQEEEVIEKPAPIEVKQRPEPVKTKWDPAESWFHALQESRVNTPTSTRDFMRRRNSHVLVISDELSFTGPQLSVIFLLMALCYYMGKLSCRC